MRNTLPSPGFGAELHAQRCALLETLFDGRVSASGGDPTYPQGERSAEEEAQVLASSPQRRLEFRNGRACAAVGLARCGVPQTPILRGRNGEPLWPAGLVGSITHSESFCAAAVARASDFVSLGLDVETDLPVSEAFARRVCSPRELIRCAALAAGGHARDLARVVFSIKESVYKLQHPLSGRILYWRDLEVALEDGHFNARFSAACPPFRAGDTLPGRWLRGAGMIMSSSWLAPDCTKAM